MGFRRDFDENDITIKRGLRREECVALNGEFLQIGNEQVCVLKMKDEGDRVVVQKPKVKYEDLLRGMD